MQRVHTLLGRQHYKWEALQAPDKPYSLTVCDVLSERPGVDRDAMLREWMCNVWECWSHQHNRVQDICHTLLK